MEKVILMLVIATGISAQARISHEPIIRGEVSQVVCSAGVIGGDSYVLIQNPSDPRGSKFHFSAGPDGNHACGELVQKVGNCTNFIVELSIDSNNKIIQVIKTERAPGATMCM